MTGWLHPTTQIQLPCNPRQTAQALTDKRNVFADFVAQKLNYT
jgi:hypothetical protein